MHIAIWILLHEIKLKRLEHKKSLKNYRLRSEQSHETITAYRKYVRCVRRSISHTRLYVIWYRSNASTQHPIQNVHAFPYQPWVPAMCSRTDRVFPFTRDFSELKFKWAERNNQTFINFFHRKKHLWLLGNICSHLACLSVWLFHFVPVYLFPRTVQLTKFPDGEQV